MIVSERNVSDALAYLADSPHPVAKALKTKTDAENVSKRTYAEAFLAAEGSVEARRAKAELDPKYVIAKEKESAAILELETHKSRIRAADMILEIWRTENANARAAERVR